MVTECLFGRLTGTAYKTGWRPVCPVLFIYFVACYALHNICDGNGEYLHIQWALHISGLQTLNRQPDPAHVHTGAVSQQAREIRDVICTHILAAQGD